MNWVGGVRRRILLKEEEHRRQEQFFAAHASSKIRNSGRKTIHKAERENTNAKTVVHIKSRSNYHQWKNEQVIYHRLRQGVPPSHLKHQERSSDFTPGIPVPGRNRTEKQDLSGAAAPDGFPGERSTSIKLNPASIHCPFSKYLLQLEVQGIENKLKEQNMRRTEAKILHKSIKGVTEFNVSIGKEERDKDKREKDLNAGKKRRQQAISILENVDHSLPCQRKRSENQLVMDDSNHQKCVSKVKFNETEKLNEKNVKNGSRKINKHGYLCSKKDKCLGIEACSKVVGRKNVSGIKDWNDNHRKGKHIASSSCANGWRGSKLANTDKRKIMSEVKKKEPNSVPSLLNGAPRLRHMLTLSPACHKGQIWAPLKLLPRDIDTNSSGRAFSQDGHDDKEAGKASHFKTNSKESIQSNGNESKSVLSQKQQENHRTSDTNKEGENCLKVLISKCTKLLPEELSHSAESTAEVIKQVQQCSPTFGKQEKCQESFKLHPRLITYITDENDKQFSGEKKNLDHEDFSACSKKIQKRELHYIYKDNTILSAEKTQKTPTPTRVRLRLSDFTRKVYEVESGLSFARNRKDKTPYLDKSIPTPWRSQTCAQTPGGSSGKSSSRTPTDPVFDRSLEDPFGTQGDSEACEVTEGNISIAKSQDTATCEAAHDIPANRENVYVTGTNLESGIHVIILDSQSDQRQCNVTSPNVRQQNMPMNDYERKGETGTSTSRVDVPQNTQICGNLNQSDVDKKDGNIVSKNEEKRSMPDGKSNPLDNSSGPPEYLYEVKRKEAPQERTSGLLTKNSNKLKDYPRLGFSLDSTQGVAEHLFFKIKTNTGLFSDSDISPSQEEIQKVQSQLIADESTREGHMNMNHWEESQTGLTHMEKVHYKMQTATKSQRYMNSSLVKMKGDMHSDVRSVGVVKRDSVKDPVISGSSEINQTKLSTMNQSSVNPFGEFSLSSIPKQQPNVAFTPLNEEDASTAQLILMNSDPRIKLSSDKAKRKHLYNIEDIDIRDLEAVTPTK